MSNCAGALKGITLIEVEVAGGQVIGRIERNFLLLHPILKFGAKSRVDKFYKRMSNKDA